MKTETNDLKIMGQMTLAGGGYQDVVVMGELSINGDLECREMKVMGQTFIKGSLKGGDCKVSGKAILDGSLEVKELKVQGQVKVGKAAKIDQLRIQGQTSIAAGLTSEEVDLQGELKVGGDCTAERFKARGAFIIDGLLNAGEIDVKQYGHCRAREIGGESIVIRRAPISVLGQFLKSIFLGLDLNGKLTAESIEGDDIQLEYTIAKVVRGNNVIIGRGCEIEMVEYKKTFEQAQDAKVGGNKKI